MLFDGIETNISLQCNNELWNWLLLLFISRIFRSCLYIYCVVRLYYYSLLSQNVQTCIVRTMTRDLDKVPFFVKKNKINGNLNCSFINLLHTEQWLKLGHFTRYQIVCINAISLGRLTSCLQSAKVYLEFSLVYTCN